MKNAKNNSTNNFVVRIWSNEYYKTDNKNVYNGTVTDVKNNNLVHFHSAGDFLKVIEKLNKLAEKDRKNVK